MMPPRPIDRFFLNPAALPSMPEIARHLLDSFGRDDLSLGELATVIAKDQALAAKLLRLANSARYNPRATVTSLKDAAATIGLTQLRGLALSACLVNAFPRPAGFDRHRFWCQSLATAGHARMLAGLLDLDGDVAETAGLVLRAGELLMLMAEPGYVALVEAMSGAPDSVFELERLHFGCSHAEVTAELAVRWRFPTAMVDALHTASDPLHAQPFSADGAVLRLASVLAEAGHDGRPAIDALQAAQGALLARLHLEPAAIAARLQPHALLTAPVDELIA